MREQRRRERQRRQQRRPGGQGPCRRVLRPWGLQGHRGGSPTPRRRVDIRACPRGHRTQRYRRALRDGGSAPCVLGCVSWGRDGASHNGRDRSCVTPLPSVGSVSQSRCRPRRGRRCGRRRETSGRGLVRGRSPLGVVLAVVVVAVAVVVSQAGRALWCHIEGRAGWGTR